MNRPDSSLREEELMSRLKAGSQLAFSQLYDRYAPTLLGVITATVSNEVEAIAILEKTFTDVYSKAGQFHPQKQPLFVWLFGIARRVTLDALKTHRPAQMLPLRLTTSGRLIAHKLPINRPDGLANAPADSRLNELLNAVVLKNCTPEEAAASLGIPVGLVRQQLRLAMRQLQDSRKS